MAFRTRERDLLINRHYFSQSPRAEGDICKCVCFTKIYILNGPYAHAQTLRRTLHFNGATSTRILHYIALNIHLRILCTLCLLSVTNN